MTQMQKQGCTDSMNDQNKKETAEEKLLKHILLMTDAVRETAVFWGGTTGEVFRELMLENLAAIREQIPPSGSESGRSGAGRLEENVIR